MTDAATIPNIRIGDAAAAIGMEKKALRNWFVKGKARHVEPRQAPGGWRAFSFADVAILAAMKEFVQWGVEVQDAENFAMTAFTTALGPRIEKVGSLPPILLRTMLVGWRFALFNISELILLPMPPGQSLDCPVPASYIHLDLHAVVDSAFTHLEAAGYSIGRDDL